MYSDVWMVILLVLSILSNGLKIGLMNMDCMILVVLVSLVVVMVFVVKGLLLVVF